MGVSKNNRLPIAILVLAFIAFFSGWVWVNQHAHIQANWNILRCTLLLGGMYLTGIFFAARRQSFNGQIVIFALGIPLVVGMLGFIFWALVVWRFPEFDADDINALFLMEACCVLAGGLIAKLFEVFGV